MKKVKIVVALIVILILSFFVPIRTEYVEAKTSYKIYYNIYGMKIYNVITNL